MSGQSPIAMQLVPAQLNIIESSSLISQSFIAFTNKNRIFRWGSYNFIMQKLILPNRVYSSLSAFHAIMQNTRDNNKAVKFEFQLEIDKAIYSNK